MNEKYLHDEIPWNIFLAPSKLLAKSKLPTNDRENVSSRLSVFTAAAVLLLAGFSRPWLMEEMWNDLACLTSLALIATTADANSNNLCNFMAGFAKTGWRG